MTDTIFTFPSSTTTLNAYTLVGGMISYDMTPWSTVYVRAENVFDQRYEEVYLVSLARRRGLCGGEGADQLKLTAFSRSCPRKRASSSRPKNWVPASAGTSGVGAGPFWPITAS